MFVLAPNGAVVALLPVAGGIEAISDAEDKDEEPGEYGQGLIDDERAATMRFSLCERVHWLQELVSQRRALGDVALAGLTCVDSLHCGLTKARFVA